MCRECGNTEHSVCLQNRARPVSPERLKGFLAFAKSLTRGFYFVVGTGEEFQQRQAGFLCHSLHSQPRHRREPGGGRRSGVLRQRPEPRAGRPGPGVVRQDREAPGRAHIQVRAACRPRRTPRSTGSFCQAWCIFPSSHLTALLFILLQRYRLGEIQCSSLGTVPVTLLSWNRPCSQCAFAVALLENRSLKSVT